jgi:CRP-like cAMP-binding protein
MVVTDSISTQYRHFCEQLGIKANSQVLQQLPTEASAINFTEWDLSGNCVGTKGAIAVLKLVQNNFPNLRRISFRGNNLASAATQDIYNTLVRHPNITSIDLSQNDIRLGGPALVDLVKRNKNIVELNIEGTFLRPLFERLIALHLKRNAENNSSGNNNNNKIVVPPVTLQAAAKKDEAPTTFAVGGGGAGRRRGAPAFVGEDDAASNNSGSAAAAEKPQRSPRKTTFAAGHVGDDHHSDGENSGSASGGSGNGGGGFGGFAFGEAADPDHQGDPDDVDDTLHVSFANIGDGKKVVRRATVSSEVYRDDEIENFVPNKNDHDPAVRQFLFKALEQHDLFSHLEDFELYVAVDAMEVYERGEGDFLFEEGDEDCDTFFIVYKGKLEISRKGNVVRTAGPGDSVQDTMLLYPGSATETGKVLQDESQFYTLDRKTYRCVLAKASKKKRAMYEGFLSTINFLKGLSKPELLSLADALKPAVYHKGEKLIEYNSNGQAFFIIVEGVVDVIGRDEKGKEKFVCDFTVGACVGELEFINDHPCVADVVAHNDILRVAKMNRRHFEMVMGPVKDVLARTAAESPVYEYYRGTQKKGGQ